MTLGDPLSEYAVYPSAPGSDRELDRAAREVGPQLVVCAPLRFEAWRLRREVARGAVVRTGLGPQRSERVAAGLRDRSARGAIDALAVAGFGGALRGDVEPGDVVVATEVRSGGDQGDDREHVRCPSAELLAGELRRQGLRVHTGPVLTVAHVVGGVERARLGETGALAVDMESAPLAEATESPVVVVRVIVDTATSPLRSLSTPRGGWAAMRSLDRVGGALTRWGAAVGPRTALLASPRSFCAGVDRAIEVVERALDRYEPPVYVRKQIVHNVHVVRDLEQRGAIFVEELDEVPEGATVVFSAHGVSPDVRTQARQRGLGVIDATCPLVTKVHSEARRFASGDNLVVLIGHDGHEEIEGTLGEAPDSTVLVEKPEDVDEIEAPASGNVSYLMQTTLATDEAEQVVDALKGRFPQAEGPSSEDICYATTNRQNAVRAVAEEADLILVVGSENSSNSLRLVEVARRSGAAAYLVDDPADIDLDWFAGVRTVGLTAGASAPPALISEVLEALRGLGSVEVAERSVTTESVHFTLPKEVRS